MEEIMIFFVVYLSGYIIVVSIVFGLLKVCFPSEPWEDVGKSKRAFWNISRHAVRKIKSRKIKIAND